MARVLIEVLKYLIALMPDRLNSDIDFWDFLMSDQ